MKQILLHLAPAALLLLLPALPARASLVGSSVTGSLTFPGDPSNYFDPGYGFVPVGYSNQTSPTVTISPTAVEFGFDDGSSLISADFNANQLTVTDFIELSGTASSAQLAFTDAAFAGLSLRLTSGNLLPSDFSLAGTNLTLGYTGGNVTAGQTYTSTYDLNPVPEPSTLTLTLTSVMLSFATLTVRSLKPTC